jgi:hypothetical protein
MSQGRACNGAHHESENSQDVVAIPTRAAPQPPDQCDGHARPDGQWSREGRQPCGAIFAPSVASTARGGSRGRPTARTLMGMEQRLARLRDSHRAQPRRAASASDQDDTSDRAGDARSEPPRAQPCGRRIASTAHCLATTARTISDGPSQAAGSRRQDRARPLCTGCEQVLRCGRRAGLVVSRRSREDQEIGQPRDRPPRRRGDGNPIAARAARPASPTRGKPSSQPAQRARE